MKFSTDTYITGILAQVGLRCGGGKKDHYQLSYEIKKVDGLLAFGEGCIMFRSTADAAQAGLALWAVGIAVHSSTATGHSLIFDSVQATLIAKTKWLGQRQGFDLKA